MQKKKILIVFFSIISFIIIFCVVMAVTYLKTDFFKSNKQLFFKYLIEKNQIWDILLENNHENNNKSYIGTGNINFIYDNNGVPEIENDYIGNELNKKITKLNKINNLYGDIKSNVDKKNKRESYKLTLSKNEEINQENDEKNIMNFEFVKDSDKYVFKSDEILKVYVGLENNNVNDLIKKIGIEDNDIIPQKINFENINENFFQISDEEKEHIYETYKDIFIQSLDSSKYQNENNKIININNNEYKTNLYSLTITKSDSIELLINMLNTLKQDSITLNLICNKIKTINPNSKYISIKDVVEQIDKYKEQVEKLEKTNEEFIKIEIYKDKNVIRKIDFSLDKEKHITFDYEEKNGKAIVEIQIKDNEKEQTKIDYDLKKSFFNTKKIRIIKDSNNIIYQIVFYNIKNIYKNIIDDIEINGTNNINQYSLEELKKIYDSYKNLNDEDVEVSFNIKLYDYNEDETRSVIYFLIYKSKIGAEITNRKKYTDEIQNIIKIDNTNSVMLNNYPKENVEQFLNLIYNNGKKILKKKIGIK